MPTDLIVASYRLATPLFCGGARPETPELRLPSVKGILRWWWRALAWSRCGGDLSKVAAAENALFGSAHSGRSKVVMRLLPSALPTPIGKGAILRLGEAIVGEGARYLGYGVIEAFARKAKDGQPKVEAGQLIRGCLQAPFDLKIELRARDLDEPTRTSELDALKLMGVLGAIGAKSRKGYGSVTLRSLTLNGASSWAPPASASDLLGIIQQLVQRAIFLRDDVVPYTALSSRARIVLVAADAKTPPLALLDRIGREMMRFRSWGHNGKVLGTDSERNFKDDHDLMKLPSGRRSKHPRRIVFGLPHNYGKAPGEQVRPADDQIDRRASPLLLHIHECDNTPVAVLTLLPAEFLPGHADAQVNVGGKRVRLSPDKELWKPAHDFLDRLLDEKRRKERLTQALEVRL